MSSSSVRSSSIEAVRVGSKTVAIVDSRPSDFVALLNVEDLPDINWRFAPSGRSALRLAQREQVDLWVINIALDDMSGADLCWMLKSRTRPPVIYIVTDAYREEDERTARGCGAALFGCKPIETSWFKT